MTDSLKQVGNNLASNARNVDSALNRKAANFSIPESIRDTFDNIVPYEMTFGVTKASKRVSLNLSFFPSTQVVTCCAGDYCMVTETFYYTELINNTTINGTVYNQVLYAKYPYVPGSVYISDPNVRLSYDNNGTLVGVYDTIIARPPVPVFPLLGGQSVLEIDPTSGAFALAYTLPASAGPESLPITVDYVVYYGG